MWRSSCFSKKDCEANRKRVEMNLVKLPKVELSPFCMTCPALHSCVISNAHNLPMLPKINNKRKKKNPLLLTHTVDLSKPQIKQWTKFNTNLPLRVLSLAVVSTTAVAATRSTSTHKQVAVEINPHKFVQSTEILPFQWWTLTVEKAG